jgi:hypothetical protein
VGWGTVGWADALRKQTTGRRCGAVNRPRARGGQESIDMYGPDISFILGDYNSREGGTGREFFALIPFAANVSKLSVSVNIVEIDANTDINITLEESLDGENWALAELLTASPITATAFKVLHTTKDFGAMARLRIKVEANTGSIAVNSRLEVRVSGKPF